MSSAKIRVHYAIVCRTAHKLSGEQFHNLLSVQNRFVFGPENEAPFLAPAIDVFVRFFVYRPGTETIFIRVGVFSQHVRGGKALVESEPKTIEFNTRQPSQDAHFRLNTLSFPFPGMYVVKVCRRSNRSWDKGRIKVLGKEYLFVEHHR